MHWNRTVTETGAVLLFATAAMLSGRLLLSGASRPPSPALFPDKGASAGAILTSGATPDRLPTGHIAFAAPETMEVGRPYNVALVLSAREPKLDMETSISRMSRSQRINTAEVKYSLQMDTRLTGPAFDIKSVTPSTQTTNMQEESQWIWSVVPTQAGDQDLHFILDANLDRGGSTAEHTIPVHVRAAR
jgi:hypothetical protein